MISITGMILTVMSDEVRPTCGAYTGLIVESGPEVKRTPDPRFIYPFRF